MTAALTAAPAHAEDAKACGQIRTAAEGASSDFRPPVSGTVIGKGRAFFHSAPADQCASNDLFIIPGDSVTVYEEYKGWYQVMYVSQKTGEDYEDIWISADRLKLDNTRQQ